MKNIIKIFLAALFFLASYQTVNAQLLRTAYFMESSPLRNNLNPALLPETGFMTIPLIGSFNASYTSNNLAMGDLFYNRNGKLVTFMDNSVDAGSFLKKVGRNNQLNADMQWDLVTAGWYTNDHKAFWTVGMSLKTTTSINIPKSLFQMMKIGNAEDGTVYNISDIRANIDAYTELSVGYSRKIDSRWTVGGRLKLLPGMGNIDMRFNQLKAELSGDIWNITSKGSLYTSVSGLELEHTFDDQGREYIDDIDYTTFGISGFGAAIDMGASYKVLDNLTVSASVLDLGFISWSKSATRYAKSEGNFEFGGFRLPIGDDDGPSISDQFDDMKEDLEDLFHFREEGRASRSTMLCATVILGGEYTILDKKLGFGLLSTTRFYKPKAYTELTASVNYRPVYWFSTTVSYSMIHSAFQTYGFAMNFAPRGFNFFIGSDYMITKVNPQYIPIKARAENIYLGMSVPLGGKRTRNFNRTNCCN